MMNSEIEKNTKMEEGIGEFLDDFAPDITSTVPEPKSEQRTTNVETETPIEQQHIVNAANIEQKKANNDTDIELAKGTDSTDIFAEQSTANHSENVNNTEYREDPNIQSEQENPNLNNSIFPVDFSMFQTDEEEETEVLDYGLGELTYSTTELAKELDVTNQTIRNYADYYSEFFSEERGQNGQRFFTENDYHLIKKIITLRNEKRYTKQQIKTLLEQGSFRERQAPAKTPAVERRNENVETHLTVSGEMITALSEQLSDRLSKGLEIIQDKMLESINSGLENTSQMKATIESQNELIAAQAKEIEDLKKSLSVVYNNTKQSVSKLDKLGQNIEQNAQEQASLKTDIIETIKANASSPDIKSLSEQITTNVKQNTDATVGAIKEQITKQSQSINNISQRVANIQQQGQKTNKNDIEEIKKDVAAQLEIQNTKIKNLLSDQQKSYSSAIKSLTDAMQTVTENTTEESKNEMEEVQEKLNSAYKTIKALAGKNGELANELKAAHATINAQDSKITDLNNKISAIISMKTQYREQHAQNPVNTRSAAPLKTPEYDREIGRQRDDDIDDTSDINTGNDPFNEKLIDSLGEPVREKKRGLFGRKK